MSYFSRFKKYKAIMASVIVFIVLDISVLVFSFYISYQISQSTAEINLAGRQRTLSQRITKNLLEFERAYHKTRPYDAIINDIEISMQAFDRTLMAFDQGGDVVVDDRLLYINPVSDAAGRQALEQAKPMWRIYKNYTADVLKEFKGRESIDEDLVTIFFRESIVKDVVIYTMNNNIALLDVMNDLTRSVERVAAEKTTSLRRAQALAIVVAIINFFVILFFSLRNLKKSDDELCFANAEMDVMLDTITEGVFLLDNQLMISEHYSKEMEVIFNDSDLSGQSLLLILQRASNNFNQEGVEKFLYALFDKNKKIHVLNTLNPLQDFLVCIDGDDKYLRFSYARIESDYEIERVLVRVADVSDEVMQEVEMKEDRERQFKHLRLLSALMNSNADLLPLFFQKGFSCFEAINVQLQHCQKNKVTDVGHVAELMNCFCREAELLALDVLVERVNNFLHKLSIFEERANYSEKSCADLLLQLKALVTYTESMCEFSGDILSVSKLSSGSEHHLMVGQVDSWLHLNEFASDIALQAHKKVEVITSGLNDCLLSKDMIRLLNSIVIQVFYHSITFSIELPEKRHYLRKEKMGLLDVRLAKRGNGGYYLTIKNDGAGVDVEHLNDVASIDSGVASTKHMKKEWCRVLLHSFRPNAGMSPSYVGELLFGDALVSLVEKSSIRFDVKSVQNEGGVFEFLLPSTFDE
jgi:two-component system chemotaxis sensor kinase CheA